MSERNVTTPMITVEELLQLLGQATADAYAWRKAAEQLATAQAARELPAQTSTKGKPS